MQPMLLQQMKSRSQLVYNKRLDAFTSLCTTLYEIILLCALAVSDSPSLVTRKRQALRAFASRSSRNPCLVPANCLVPVSRCALSASNK